MEFEESIYNLIPKDAYVPPKEARYKSSHHPKTEPTASTFTLRTTSKPGVANLKGQTAADGGSHSRKANGATFGLPKGVAKPNAN